MKYLAVLFVLLTAVSAGAQVERITISAGTPEDRDSQAITAESDPAKRLALLQEFIGKFSSNPQAVAWGNWQVAHHYLEQGDTAKAMDYGRKALAIQPANLDILVFIAGIAQQTKAADALMDYVVQGATAFHGIASQPKPEALSAEQFADRVRQEQDQSRQSYEYLEATGLNALVAEQDAKKRIGYIERYIAAFPGSRYQDQATQLAVYTLGQLHDPVRLTGFADKALAASPNSIALLVILADAFAESADANGQARAEKYARQVLDLAKGQTPTEENKLRLYSGLAHSTLGYTLLKQEKNIPAIAELKTATTELKGTGDAYSGALYRLSFAYAKTAKLQDAKVLLTELVEIQGPYQQLARDLLTKVNDGIAKAGKRKK